MSDPTPVLLFARAPLPGRAKTRLQPRLGADGAAALAAAFLEDAVRSALAVPELAPVLVCDGTLTHPRLRTLLASAGLPIRAQAAGDLGARMARALAEALAGCDRALLVGTDVPTLPPYVLAQAAEALRTHDLVFGPAADGGFYLVGARGAPPELEGPRWSTPHALADTLARNRARSVAYVTPWYDVDAPADLRLLRAHLAEDRVRAPATRAALARWDTRASTRNE